MSSLRITSRLPDIGTNVFSSMTELALKHGAINLGQGFPDFDCDPALVDAVGEALRREVNQYAPMPGVMPLRELVSAKIQRFHGRRYDPSDEITITSGASQAIMTAVLALVHPGDEVILLTPCYDSYAPSVALAGGWVRFVPLSEDGFRPDFARIAAALGPRTRAIVLNTPNNPSATCWTRQDMEQLAALLAPTDTLVISDEVYEHIVFDGEEHVSAASVPGLAERSIVVSSFGKTLHITGWKIGTAAAPRELMREFRKVHQFNVFTVNTPMQYGVAEYLRSDHAYAAVGTLYQAKRDLFRAGLAESRFNLLPVAGSYFQCVDYGAIRDCPDTEFCEWLVKEVGVAAIPMSAFHESAPSRRIVRFCFAKRDETLSAAIQRLAKA